MIHDIYGLDAKKLVLAAKELEKKHGESVPHLLVRFIYEAYERGEHMAFIEAVRVFHSILYVSGLTLDDLEAESPAEILSLNRSGLDDK